MNTLYWLNGAQPFSFFATTAWLPLRAVRTEAYPATLQKRKLLGIFFRLLWHDKARRRETKHATQCCIDKHRGPLGSCHGPSVGVPVEPVPRANLGNVDLDGLGMNAV